MLTSCTFPRWSTSVTVVSTEGPPLRAAVDVVRTLLDEVEAAASRFRCDSELSLLRPGANKISAMLADLVTHALDAARVTDGLVDPTVGSTLAAWGYDRSIELVDDEGPGIAIVPQVPGWRTVA